MRIGMIAMSGIRAYSPRLMEVGLTLPAVVERGKIVASMPTLSLLTLAAMCPPDADVEYHEIQDLQAHGELPGNFDLVAIASLSAQVKDAYAVADHYRAQGTAVVMGGLHVLAEPDEAARHCTSIAIGEGELLWPQMLEDFRNGNLQARYEVPPNTYFDLADAPIPRWDLLDIDKYNRLTVQTTRGCPHLCDFCASSVLLTPKYSVKPVDKVIAEIRAIKQYWEKPFIEFADDNSFIARREAKALLKALGEEDISWFTETDISIADDPELLDIMKDSGCKQVLIGLESPQPTGLKGLEIKRDWKLKRQPNYAAAIDAIQSRGITVNGCFILGLDGHTPETFDAIYRFAEATALWEVQITVLTPFPGTPLYARLLRENRILDPGAWEKCTLFDVNFQPTDMTPEQLEDGMIALAERLYAPDFVQRRRELFFERRKRSA